MRLSLFFTFVLLTGLTSLQAQVKFEFLPDTLFFPTVIGPDTAIADTHIHSLVAEDITLRWQRNVLTSLPTGSNTQVCDLNACYPPTFNTRTFNLVGNSQGIISIHLNASTAVSINTVVRLDFWEEDNPDTDTIPAYFVFGPLSGTKSAPNLAQARIYPNPSSDFVTIETLPDAGRITIVDLYGKEAASFEAEQGRRYFIGHLPTGKYAIVIQDKRGTAIQAGEIVKQ